MARLVAFGLTDPAGTPPGTASVHNVHVIGDAYSDYQGFIEGALRSTGRLLTYYVTGQASTEFSDRAFLETWCLPA